MENSKTLIVIVSVSLFVAAVLGLGLVLFYPREEPQVAQPGEEARARDDFDAIEYLRDEGDQRPSLDVDEDADDRDEEEDDVVIVYGESVEERGRDRREADEVDGADDSREESPPAERSAPQEETEEAEAEGEPEESAPQPEPAPEEPEEQEESATPARAAPQSEAETRTVEVTEYWIQVVATTSRDRIDRARERLSEHQLKGRVTTKNVEGKTFYRLRVGPYTNKEEAGKFLDWVNDIEGFGESYISEEYSTRTVSG